MKKRALAATERTATTWIQTYTGRQFWPLAPQVEEVDIEDIAHALSLLCRFNGHCRGFYSVAEHALHVASLVEPSLALWGLLHDAGEAYLSDLPRPIKSVLPGYRHAESRVMQVVATGFGLCWPMPPAIKWADGVMLATEKIVLMGAEPAPWAALPPAIDPAIIRCYPPATAKALFLEEFHRIFQPVGV